MFRLSTTRCRDVFLKSRPLLAYFRPFLITISRIQIEKSVDGMLGIHTLSPMMVGADNTTELWWPTNRGRLTATRCHYNLNVFVAILLYLSFQGPLLWSN